MNATKITPSAGPLPAQDRLYQTDSGAFIRARVCLCNTLEKLRAAMPEAGTHEMITISIQCALAKDASGDVIEDADADHVILPMEYHSILVDNLLMGMDTLEGWSDAKIIECVLNAGRKAFVLGQVLTSTLFPEDQIDEEGDNA